MDKYWVWLSRLYKIGAKKQNELIKRYKTPKKIWDLSEKELNKIEFLNKTDIEMILNKEYKENINKYIEYMNKNEIELITIEDKKYPEKLKNIYDSPIALYIKGNKEILNDKSIAIVGSRNCSKYGALCAKEFADKLSKNNIIIVSGLARGIDTYSHTGTLKKESAAIAVVGSGLDIIYPSENRKLLEEIIKYNGVIVSEYIVGVKPQKEHFPARNRIISGISDGVLVIEASSRSGTFITVDFAIEQGKEVYAVPRKYF